MEGTVHITGSLQPGRKKQEEAYAEYLLSSWFLWNCSCGFPVIPGVLCFCSHTNTHVYVSSIYEPSLYMELCVYLSLILQLRIPSHSWGIPSGRLYTFCKESSERRREIWTWPFRSVHWLGVAKASSRTVRSFTTPDTLTWKHPIRSFGCIPCSLLPPCKPLCTFRVQAQPSFWALSYCIC